MTSEERVRTILELSRYTGREISSEFIRKTADHFPAASIQRIHNLIEGIYKPVGDQYAFCIWSRSAAGAVTEIYPDILKPQSDGTWIMQYAAKQEGKEPLVEAEAAHIISVDAKGPDDPRNGLSLCKRHHWAFDEGLFTVI